ncbi:MAG: putative lactoylglutathione lyase [Oceanicoccus sp.]|jgi:predicted lactoylglutathione lyase
MSRQIFINLATKNLSEAKHFFGEIGFQFNAKFCNEDGCCVIIADNISVMLLSERHFKNFTDKAICDSHTSAETLLCITCDSREEVDGFIVKAKSRGAKISPEIQDNAFMYGRGFEDLDGHTWELLYLEIN